MEQLKRCEKIECYQDMNVMYMALYPLIMIRPNASSKGSKALFCGCFYKDVLILFNYKD